MSDADGALDCWPLANGALILDGSAGETLAQICSNSSDGDDLAMQAQALLLEGEGAVLAKRSGLAGAAAATAARQYRHEQLCKVSTAFIDSSSSNNNNSSSRSQNDSLKEYLKHTATSAAEVCSKRYQLAASLGVHSGLQWFMGASPPSAAQVYVIYMHDCPCVTLPHLYTH